MNKLRQLFRGKRRRRDHEQVTGQHSAPPERLQFDLPVKFAAHALPSVQTSMPVEKPSDLPVRLWRSKSCPEPNILKEVLPFEGDDDNEHASVPVEIFARGPQALEAYNRAIEEGKTSVKRVPIMLIGQGQSGKTSLKRSLKGEEFNPDESSTVGIETDPSYCRVSTEVWKMGEATRGRDSNMELISYERHTARYIASSLEKKELLKPSPSRYDRVTDLFSSAGIPSLFVKFKSGQVPIGLFPRLVLMVMQWCTREGHNEDRPQLHYNFVRFYTHPAKAISLVLLSRSSSIEVVVHQGKRMSEVPKNEGMNLPSVFSHDTSQIEFARTVCRQLGLILECMRKEFHWLRNMAYEMSVCCPICCTRKAVEHCENHRVSKCKEEECFHFWSESHLRNCQRPLVCTKSATAGDYRVPLERFATWFPFLDKEGVTGEGNEEAALTSTEGKGEQAIVLSDELLQALQLRTCDADGVVALLQHSLSLDLSSTEQPDPETKPMIRCLCSKAQSAERHDVVKRLREIAPSGTTGPLLPETCDILDIPTLQRVNLTIHMCGEYLL
ncbi:hypothetical protein AWC38_SpisGene7817 [Stylophora pistillata]|uniref:Uncharacterized protein n=1 Tax=Stylophora pistillata TaxID=50429 RepID=A0A2B4SDQ2_STYPI|nr:hypothetical protein AWC38_SpisGene7817 [Stylophora pistillata]